MLQKGFLKRRENNENSRIIKRSRIFLVVGIFIIILGFFVLTTLMQQEQETVSIAGIVLFISGFLLLTVSFWMNYFARNKNRQC